MDAHAASLTIAGAAEACRDAAHWSDVAMHAATALDADGGAVAFFGRDGALARACPRTDPDIHRRYDAALHAANHLWTAVARLPAGRAASEVMLGGRRTYLRSPIFNEFIRPQAMDGLLLLTLTGQGAPAVGVLTLGRRPGRAAFSAADIEDATVLAGALARTIAAVGFMPMATTDAAGTEVLVTPDCRLLSRPAGLDVLLRTGVVTVANGRLACAALPGLPAAVHGAARDPGAWPPPVAATFGPLPAGDAALRIVVTPGGASGPGAARIRFEPAAPPDPAAALQRHYGLTRRETEVALCLGEGRTLPEAAESLGIGLSTARTHLTRLFDKTGTRTQLGLALHIARQLERRR